MPSYTETTKCSHQYWAGFFDGEGCIMLKIDQKRGCSRPQVNLQISASNTNREVMDALCLDFPPPCGRVLSSYLGGPKDQIRRRQQYKWARSGQSAIDFIIAVLPYLVIKKDQAKLAIEFWSLPWRSQRSSRGGGWKIRTQGNVQTDLDYAFRMKGLKRALNN